MRPFLKWPGGKMQLLDEILPHLPKNRPLIEPFVGAGAIFLNSDHPINILNDINPDLIALYTHLQKNGTQFIQDAEVFFTPKYNQKKQYLAIRAQFNQETSSYKRAVFLLYLNRHGYNGLCRYNLKGGYNVPFGYYTKPYFPKKEMLEFFEKSKNFSFSTGCFTKVFTKLPPKSVIYCDPPYAPLSNTANFNQYHGKFSWEQQILLAECAQKAAKKGHTVIISNHDTPQVRKLYQNARLIRIKANRTISCKATHRKKVWELLAIYD